MGSKGTCYSWYHNSRQFTTEEAITLASTAVKMAAKKRTLEEVYLLGCNVTGDTLQKCEQISKNLQEESICVQILSNVLYDAEAMEKLENAVNAPYPVPFLSFEKLR